MNNELLKQETAEQKSKFAGSKIGSHHWAATVLSYIMRVGEYLNDHGRSTDKDEMNYRGWGHGIHERAIEVNDFLQSLPEMIQNELKEKGNFLEAYNRECKRVDHLVDEVSKKNLRIQELQSRLKSEYERGYNQGMAVAAKETTDQTAQ